MSRRSGTSPPRASCTCPAPAGTPGVKLETLNLEDPQASASGQITIRVPHEDADSWSSPTFWDSGWFFSIGGASFSGDGTSVAPAGGLVIGTINAAAGATIKTDMDWSTYHAEVGKWIAGSDFDSGGDTRLDLYAMVGARLHSQDVTIVSGADEINASETFGASLSACAWTPSSLPTSPRSSM
ncbi:MAG: hypothetical protein QM783_04235 [Phycisphaerales bacterium]